MADPRLPLTVSRALWDEVANDIAPEFADSYLSGANETASTLVPHTVTAFRRLEAKSVAMAVLKRRKLKLIEPLPFGHRDRSDGRRSAA